MLDAASNEKGFYEPLSIDNSTVRTCNNIVELEEVILITRCTFGCKTTCSSKWLCRNIVFASDPSTTGFQRRDQQCSEMKMKVAYPPSLPATREDLPCSLAADKLCIAVPQDQRELGKSMAHIPVPPTHASSLSKDLDFLQLVYPVGVQITNLQS